MEHEGAFCGIRALPFKASHLLVMADYTDVKDKSCNVLVTRMATLLEISILVLPSRVIRTLHLSKVT
jgi:hypothetical protein